MDQDLDQDLDHKCGEGKVCGLTPRPDPSGRDEPHRRSDHPPDRLVAHSEERGDLRDGPMLDIPHPFHLDLLGGREGRVFSDIEHEGEGQRHRR